MKLSQSRIVSLVAIVTLIIVLAILLITAPKNPQAILRVVDASGKPIAGAVIQPNGLRVKPGPYSGGWYGWSEERQHVPNRPVTTDKNGLATVPYPFYVTEKLEAGTLCLAVEHPDYVAQSPERVVATALPHGAPWRSRLQDLFDRIRHHAIETRPDPIVLQKGATLRITVTNLPPTGSGNLVEQISRIYGDHDFWTEPAHGLLESHQISEGKHTGRVAFIQTNGTVWFSDVVAFNAVKNKTNNLTLAVNRGASVHGQLDKTVPRPVKRGRIVANAWPTGIKPEDGPPQWHAWTPINEDGTFIIPSLPAGDLEIVALCNGFINTNGPGKFNFRYPQKHQLGTSDLSVTVGMESTATLEVTLRDDTDKAVTNAIVATWPNVRWGEWGAVVFASDCYNTSDWTINRDRIKSWMEDRNPDFQSTSDKNGIAVLSNLPPTTDALDVQHDRLALPVSTNGWAGEKTRAITLKLTTKQTNYLSLRLVPKEQSVISHY